MEGAVQDGQSLPVGVPMHHPNQGRECASEHLNKNTGDNENHTSPDCKTSLEIEQPKKLTVE